MVRTAAEPGSECARTLRHCALPRQSGRDQWLAHRGFQRRSLRSMCSGSARGGSRRLGPEVARQRSAHQVRQETNQHAAFRRRRYQRGGVAISEIAWTDAGGDCSVTPRRPACETESISCADQPHAHTPATRTDRLPLSACPSANAACLASTLRSNDSPQRPAAAFASAFRVLR